MKQFLIIILISVIVLITSCSEDVQDISDLSISYKRVPIEEVILPNQLVRGQSTEIAVSYYRPSSCHSFSGFDYENIANEQIISVINIVENNPDCENLAQTDSVIKNYTFLVGSEDSYIFKFWQGLDNEGNSLFLTIEVPVIEGNRKSISTN